jgi:hypothetical protein
MKPVIYPFFLVGLVLLVTGCDRSGSGERGHFEIRNVEVEQRDPGVYEVTFDATWEGDLSVQESSCMVQVMGTDTPLATGKAKMKELRSGQTCCARRCLSST